MNVQYNFDFLAVWRCNWRSVIVIFCPNCLCPQDFRILFGSLVVWVSGNGTCSTQFWICRDSHFANGCRLCGNGVLNKWHWMVRLVCSGDGSTWKNACYSHGLHVLFEQILFSAIFQEIFVCFLSTIFDNRCLVVGGGPNSTLPAYPPHGGAIFSSPRGDVKKVLPEVLQVLVLKNWVKAVHSPLTWV